MLHGFSSGNRSPLTRPELATLRRALTRFAAALRHIVGAPDYERYLAHVRRAHPGVTPLTADEYARDALARRYDKPGSRCC